MENGSVSLCWRSCRRICYVILCRSIEIAYVCYVILCMSIAIAYCIQTYVHFIEFGFDT